MADQMPPQAHPNPLPPLPDPQTVAVKTIRLEQEFIAARALAGYARFYGPMVLLALAAPFVSLYLDGSDGTPIPSEWEIAGDSGSGTAIGAIFLLAVVSAMLLVAVFRPRTRGIPGAAASILAVLAVMLITSPGLRDPDLSGAGQFLLLALALTIAVAIIHEIHLGRLAAARRRGRLLTL